MLDFVLGDVRVGQGVFDGLVVRQSLLRGVLSDFQGEFGGVADPGLLGGEHTFFIPQGPCS